MRLSRALGSLAVASLSIVTTCGGGDDDAASEVAGNEAAPEDRSSPGGSSEDVVDDTIPGGGTESGDQTGSIPDVDVCSLATDTIREMLVEINPHLDDEPTADRSTDLKDRPQCEWRIGTNLPMTVAVGTYNDLFFHEGVLQTIDATPIAGLGDDAYMTVVMRADLSWRRDDFSVHIAGFPPDRVVAIAHEIDSQMPR